MERVDLPKVLRTTEVLMINNLRSLSPRLALNEEGKEKTNARRESAPKLGKRPGKNKEDDTIFWEGMQKLQEQGDRITGVL